MKKVKINPTASIIVSLPAGVPVDGLQAPDGQVYVPMGIISIEGAAETAAPSTAPKAGGTAAAKPAKASPAADDKVYTEEELTGMSTDELDVIIKDRGLAVPKEGKNTNKKLRTVILDAQDEDGGAAPAEDDDEPEAKGAEGDDELSADVDSIADYLEKVDDGAIEHEDALNAIEALGKTKAAKKAARAALQTFLDDSNMEIEDAANSILEAVTEEPEEEAPKARGARGAAKPAGKAKEKELTPDEYDTLEVDDEVEVYWAEMKKYFKGIVTDKVAGKRGKPGKIMVYYTEDKETEELIPTAHPKVKLLPKI